MSEKITNLINLTIQHENLIDHKIFLHGQTGKGDGYLGQISFATITGKTKNGEPLTLNVAIKTSTESQLVRRKIPIKLCFEKEIYIYEDVLPAFKKFQQQFGLDGNLEKLLPICYVTQIGENAEALVLENLKVKHYDVWDRKMPMTDEHIKLILDGYGRWHGLAIALKAREPKMFEKLVAKNDYNMWPYYIKLTKIGTIFHRYFEEVRSAWKHEKEMEKEIFSLKQVENILTELSLENLGEQVILHGDSWTNNFMFQTEVNSGKPQKVSFIDWQLSGLASPILDLSVFIYSCVDTEKNQDVEVLLKIYYDSLEKSVHNFGCNLHEIFPFDKLMKHWRKFSCYGLLLANFLLRFSLSESEDCPDFASTVDSGRDFLEFFDFTTSNAKLYHQRGKNNILHYLKNL